MHRMLERQLRLLGLGPETPPSSPEQWAALLVRIGYAYREADDDRALLERAIDVSEQKMNAMLTQVESATASLIADERARADAQLSRFFLLQREPMAFVDSAGRITRANPALHACFPGAGEGGVDWDAQPHLSALVDPEMREEAEHALRRALLAADAPGWDVGAERFEVRMNHPSGALWMAWSVVAAGPGGPLFCVGYDVSERKKLDALKNEFVSMVSHELRTPLTSIKGSLDLLIAGIGGDLPQKATHLLRIAGRNTERLLKLINDILNIRKLESGTLEFDMAECDVQALLNEAVTQNASYALAHGVELAADAVDLSDVALVADADRLMQVLTNLVSNACKFSPKGEVVRVRAEVRLDEVVFSVTDRGPGIPPDAQSQVFEPFMQVNATDATEKGGTGLGLSIAKAIVAKHEGRMIVSSAVGEGSTFGFALKTGAQ